MGNFKIKGIIILVVIASALVAAYLGVMSPEFTSILKAVTLILV